MSKINNNTVLSGVQPSGDLHIGNYLGAIKNFVDMQNNYNCFFCIVDLHAITVKQDPKILKRNTLEVAATYIASGIDPKNSVIFNQSSVSAHSELAWIFNCVTRMGWLNRMTPFKDSFSPIENLSQLYGNEMNGEWIIQIEDNFEGTSGNLMDAELIVIKQHMFQLEMIKSSILNSLEILHRNLIGILIARTFFRFLCQL